MEAGGRLAAGPLQLPGPPPVLLHLAPCLLSQDLQGEGRVHL